VVYRTDAVTEDRVRILDTAPAESHNPVRYGVAVVWTARNISAAADFIQFMLSARIQAQLKQFGFDQAVSDVGYATTQEVKP
jgi:molybdate transport system substrate-binding protein